MTTLHDRLEDLAVAAPTAGETAGDLWDRGVRRTRARRAGAAAAVVAVVALVAGVVVVRPDPAPPEPADVPFEDLHLPTVVHAPGTWSDEEQPVGPWAAVGIGARTRPDGLTGESEGLELFAVSAVDGRSEWIDLPGFDETERELSGWFALSPDGQWLAWDRRRPSRRGVEVPIGWAVMSTTTGRVLELADPSASRLRWTVSEPVFSGDSRYLLVSSEPADGPRRRAHHYLAFDVTDGGVTVLEEPGHYWLPNPGSAPTGAVWARHRTVYRADPASGERASYLLPRDVITASWAPDDRAFAYIARQRPDSKGPWRLYAGRDLAEARGRVVTIEGVQPDQLLGWTDDRHVVVGVFRPWVYVVDIVTGAVDKVDMKGKGDILNAPQLAADLWQNPLVEPPEQEGTTDPRTPYRWGGGAFLALLTGAAALVLWRRRRA